MKNKVLALALLGSGMLFSQGISFGTKAGISFLDKPDSSVFSTNQTIDALYNNVKNSSNGYHIGLFSRIHISSFFIQPEVYFTTFKTEFVSNAASQSEYEVTQKRIDVPVLAGINALKIVRLQAGPHFTYNFEDEISLDEITNIQQENISVGVQLGAGIDIGKIGFDVRYERRLTDSQTEFLQNNSSFTMSQIPDQLVASVSYQF